MGYSLNDSNEEYNAESIVDFIEDRLEIGEDEAIPALVVALQEFMGRLNTKDSEAAWAEVMTRLENM